MKGVIKDYRVEKLGRDNFKITLAVHLEETGDKVEVPIYGTLNELCSRLNVIPYKGSIVANNLVNSSCTIAAQPVYTLQEINAEKT